MFTRTYKSRHNGAENNVGYLSSEIFLKIFRRGRVDGEYN